MWKLEVVTKFEIRHFCQNLALILSLTVFIIEGACEYMLYVTLRLFDVKILTY